MVLLYVKLICVVYLATELTFAGILDVNWSRSDKIGIEVNLNLPWLPCKFFLNISNKVVNYYNRLVENETRCYDELGCLNITRSWYHLIHRPFNMFPLPRSVINTRFILYTRLNPAEVSCILLKFILIL